ncbi:MAG: hypothetical protein EA389_04585 [Ilumatobacter sp.]|nr:MAG: hypothetical protein EA389_04585 [Ilumatobacter sp.]
MLDNTPFGVKLIIDDHLADVERRAALSATIRDERRDRRAARTARWASALGRLRAPRRKVVAQPIDAPPGATGPS